MKNENKNNERPVRIEKHLIFTNPNENEDDCVYPRVVVRPNDFARYGYKLKTILFINLGPYNIDYTDPKETEAWLKSRHIFNQKLVIKMDRDMRSYTFPIRPDARNYDNDAAYIDIIHPITMDTKIVIPLPGGTNFRVTFIYEDSLKNNIE